MGQQVKFLVTVKTYPHPSESYMELVCTAGLREDGSFMRLYPVDYRYRPYWEWYEKYQWIEVTVEKNEKDPRPESYRPVEGSSIRPLGPRIDPQQGTWALRKEIVLAKPIHTMCWHESHDQREVSLGLIRPREVLDLKVEEIDREWKSQWLKFFDQRQLFGPQRKPLEKIPYKFSYVFKCEEPGCNGHTKMIEDWELGALYLKMREKYLDEHVAIEKVKDKFLGKLCAQNIDTHFFVGTVLSHGTYVVLGVFWPKKQDQLNLPL